MPRRSSDGKSLIEPHPPFEPLGIVHLAADTKRGFWSLFDPAGQTHHRTWKPFMALFDFNGPRSAGLNRVGRDALGDAVVDRQGIENVPFVADDPRVHERRHCVA